MKLPSFQFYPGDWMKDPDLRSVSLAARGLWTDMLCLMHESDRRGYLQHKSGKPVDAEQLARIAGCSTDQVSHLLLELENAGVFSRTEHNMIYSRRIVRDEKLRKIRAKGGKLGGNPKLMNKDNQEVNLTDNLPATPSSSVSSSASSSTPKKEKALTLEANDASRLFKNGNGINHGYDMELVSEICFTFQDEKSRGFYIQQARRLGDGLVRECFADVQSKIREGVDVGNPGAYLARLLKNEK